MKSRVALRIGNKPSVLNTEQMYNSQNQNKKSEKGPEGDKAGLTGCHLGLFIFASLSLGWSHVLGQCISVS